MKTDGAVTLKATGNLNKASFRRPGCVETQRLIFIGGEDYAVEIGQIREIIRKREITPMPKQPPYVARS
jgi:hypothetical protein